MVEALSIRSLNERVALFLVRVGAAEDGLSANGGPAALTLPMSHRELAKVVGSSPEALSRAFRALSEQGVLSVDGRSIAIHDPAELARLAGEPA